MESSGATKIQDSSLPSSAMQETKAAPNRPRRRVESAKGTHPQPTNLRVARPQILEARNIVKAYRKNNHEVPVLRGCDFEAASGQMTAILGQSGSGKSTLLHLLGTLDVPDAGEISYDGLRIDNLSRKARDKFRNAQLGMIFQFYHLLPELTALQNVLIPLLIREGVLSYFRRRSEIRGQAVELLERVGLGHRIHHKPREMSGGEMQRAAIARALISEPELLLADEPTGNLDRENGDSILQLLRELNKESELTIVMVTHDESIAQRCDAIVHLEDGRVVDA